MKKSIGILLSLALLMTMLGSGCGAPAADDGPAASEQEAADSPA